MNNWNKIDQAVYELLSEEASRYGLVVCSIKKIAKDVLSTISCREYDSEQEEFIFHSVRKSLNKLESENRLTITNTQDDYLEIDIMNPEFTFKFGNFKKREIERYRGILEKKDNEIYRLQSEKRRLYKELDRLSEEVRLFRQKDETPEGI